jgi:hypothetical protein
MRSTTKGLDIEHPFDLVSDSKSNRRSRHLCPVTGARVAPPKGAANMAMVRVEPVEVSVRADWFDGRPREVTLDGRRLRVLEVVGVRNESAAFPVVTGPRTLFEVETADARLQLAFRHRSRRWTVERMDDRRAA